MLFVHACVWENVRTFLWMHIWNVVYQHMFSHEENNSLDGFHPFSSCYIQPPCTLLNVRAQLNGWDNSIEWSSFSHTWSPGFLNICGQTLHHLHCSAHRQGRGWEEARKMVLIVAFAPVLSSDLPLFPISHSYAGLLHEKPHLLPFALFFPFFFYPASLSVLFPPSHLSLSCSQFTFSIVKCFEASRSLKMPSSCSK